MNKIETEADYQRALEKVDQLWGTADGAELKYLDELVKEIMRYESTHLDETVQELLTEIDQELSANHKFLNEEVNK